jgi:hypothetical protein
MYNFSAKRSFRTSSRAMNKSYIEILKEVEEIFNNYTENHTGSRFNRKIVLVLDDTSNLLYNFLVPKYVPVNQKNFKLLLPNILEADNAKFAFYNHDKNDSSEVEIANKIYFRKEIFYRKYEMKVLSASQLTYEFCDDCLGYYFCPPVTTRPCFNTTSDEFDKNIFEFLSSHLRFEKINMGLYDWKVSETTLSTVTLVYKEFQKDLNNFANNFCNYLAPEEAYKNSSITVQNETYTRFQMTHQFRYDYSNVFFLPLNFEEVFRVSFFLNIMFL